MNGFDGPAITAEFFREPGVNAIFVAALGYPSEPAGSLDWAGS